MEKVNPFSLVRASDYTDDQINRLWVDIGQDSVEAIIEPWSRISKFILGGKGTGKTHLLRYYSYPAARLRRQEDSGIDIIKDQKFLATFLRATGVDAARFEMNSSSNGKWQQLFGIYLELRLAEGVVDALCDIKCTSSNDSFDDAAFLAQIRQTVIDKSLNEISDLEEFNAWLIGQRRIIDDAINNAAFTGNLDIRVPFAIGSLCLPINDAIASWNRDLAEIPLIYLIDEIENFSASQQQVVNTLIRYGESKATFRVTGRLYSRKTQATLASGEKNREGSEFKTVHLDEILRGHTGYADFAKKFIMKRLHSSKVLSSDNKTAEDEKDPSSFFEQIDSKDFFSLAFEQLKIQPDNSNLIGNFHNELSYIYPENSYTISLTLTEGLPPLLQRLNMLLFCKKHKKDLNADLELSKDIKNDSENFIEDNSCTKPYYRTAYGHYKYDLFAQICRESSKSLGVPYAGFDTFLHMSSGNPRSLLIILGHVYSIATFKGLSFAEGTETPISIQTSAAREASRFMYEADSNFGEKSDIAREAVSRLATLLRTARYALNIPEVSPLALSFSDSELTAKAREVLSSALNYSFIFEIGKGRPDRNSLKHHRKIQLNPLLSAKWQLPTSRRGDISLNGATLNSIFDPSSAHDFDSNLKALNNRWNQPFKKHPKQTIQRELF